MINHFYLKTALFFIVLIIPLTCWPEEPKLKNTLAENKVINFDKNFKGTFDDVVGKEIDIVGIIHFNKQDGSKVKAIGTLRGAFGEILFIPNWGDVWHGKKVRIIGVLSTKSAKDHADYLNDHEPIAMQVIDHYFYLTIRQIELLKPE